MGNMRFLFKIIPILLIVMMIGGGCAVFRNPTKSWDKAEAKVTTVEKKMSANQAQIIEQGKNYVYATSLALKADPSTNKYHAVETQLNDKALATLGPPTMDQINKLEGMVSNLLSDNQKLVNKGEAQLLNFDKIVSDLQTQNELLQSELNSAQTKLEKVGSVNSDFAQKWNTLIKYVWYFIYLIIFVVAVKVLSAVLPPPYNSIVGIVAVPIGCIVKIIQSLIPEAKTTAGVVHQNYKTATEDLITIIQKLKEKHPELHQEISESVYANTDSDTSAVAINEAKTNLGIVS